MVTDSTASLPSPVVEEDVLALVAVVPLRVLAGGLAADDGAAAAAAVGEAAGRGERLTTARPAPDRFAAVYRAAADAGAGAVVSVHLPAEFSGTIASAELAAAASPVPVRVVDARTIGTGLGLAVLDAAMQAAAGLGPDAIAASAGRFAERSGSFFALADQDALLAGGRMQAPASFSAGHSFPREHGPAGARLVSRPIMRIGSGHIEPVERVRTMAAAAERLAELASRFAGAEAVDVAVEHTAAASRAAEVADRLKAVIPQVRRNYVVASGMAILAHTGRGMLGVTVAPRLAE